MVLTGVHRGPHQAFYTCVKLLVLAQHPVVLFNTFGCYFNTLWCYVDTLGCNVNTWGCGPLLTPTGVKFNTPVFAVWAQKLLVIFLLKFINVKNTHTDTDTDTHTHTHKQSSHSFIALIHWKFALPTFALAMLVKICKCMFICASCSCTLW